MRNNYVWYASYGSNLNQDRLLCYIQGGKPEGSDTAEIGCRDKTDPKDSQPISIPYPLYFSGYSKKWDGGPAFIGHDHDKKHNTLGRMYLITDEQFYDVVRQENRDQSISINLDRVIKQKIDSIDDQSPYGRIVYLGENKGYPIFTFTSNQDMIEREITSPSVSYLTTIIKGIWQTYQLDNEEIVNYFTKKAGIQDNWSIDQLTNLILNEVRN